MSDREQAVDLLHVAERELRYTSLNLEDVPLDRADVIRRVEVVLERARESVQQ